jgi:tetratricopeptide (TPR) repeat protein
MASIVCFRRTLLTLAAFALLGACATSGTRAQRGPGALRAIDGIDARRQRVTLARADSAWESGAYPLATDLYESLVTRDSSSSSAAIFRLATLRAWDNRFDEGIALFRRYIALEPRDTEGRLALASTIAWSGQYSSAIAIYDSVIARDSTYRAAVLGRAQTLAWAGRNGEALAAYQRWMTLHPTDRDAPIAYARVLSWNGQLGEAESLYTELSRTGNANARKGLARVVSWRGDLQRSERTWRQVLVTDPDDPEALTGLAQVLSWQGRQSEAATALQQALRANPSYGDARALLRLVQADLRPSVVMTVVGRNDSDNNRSTSLQLDYIAHAPWSGALSGRFMERWANSVGTDARVDAVSLFANWLPDSSSLRLSAEAGISRHSATLAPAPALQRTIASGALRASGNVGRALTIAVGASHAPFDETALLIASGVVSSDVQGEAEVALPARLKLSGAASHARITGGARENSRNAYASTLRWMYNRRWSLALGARQFGYDTTSSDGYFSPRRYRLIEISGRGHVGADLGWTAEGDAGVGRQSIEFFGFSGGSRLAERVSLTAGYRFDRVREVGAAASYANVAAPGQAGGSEYKAFAFLLRARMWF